MSIVLQHRRGTTAQHATFTGAAGEVTYDTTKKTLVAHDGLTAGGIALAKETALVFPGFMSGLTGESETSAPTTKFNLRADSVTTRDATGKTRTYFNVTSKQVDLTLANSIGGRDQVAAFAAYAEPNLFWVPDGSGSLGLVLSLNGPNTGPTGYSEWAMAVSHKLNGSAQFIQGNVIADVFEYSVPQAIVTNGGGSFPSSVSTQNYIPLLAGEILYSSSFIAGTNSGGNGSGLAQVGLGTQEYLQMPLVLNGANQNTGGGATVILRQTSARTIAYGSAGLVGSVATFAQTVRANRYTMKNGAR
ncbi:hypothetical protein [Herbaspirillum huttiense]|nr:hypothetical protein [Herbaspirillum huttiense]MEE1637152.1 hypothetical protein [Herbaspirillum huttiense NC40101]